MVDALNRTLAGAGPVPQSGTLTTIVAVCGVVAGLLVGLATPLLTARLARRSSRGREQHEVADRILQLWERAESVEDLLVDDLYSTRRKLLLLGSRLDDAEARGACLRLVHFSSADGLAEGEIIDHWSELISSVARVYRNTER